MLGLKEEKSLLYLMKYGINMVFGTNTLIKNGAILVTSVQDIFEEFDSDSSKIDYNKLKRFNYNEFLCNDLFNNYLEKISVEDNFLESNLKSEPIGLAPQKFKKKVLSDSDLSYIYDLISDAPISTNELCKKTLKPVSKISGDLFMLEVNGFIKKIEGGYVCVPEE